MTTTTTTPRTPADYQRINQDRALTRREQRELDTLIRAEAVRLWSHKNARHPMIRRDGSVVVTVDGVEGTSQIFVGWADELCR